MLLKVLKCDFYVMMMRKMLTEEKRKISVIGTMVQASPAG